MLLQTQTDDEDSSETVLPQSFSITRIDDLLEQMRIYEAPKRSYFSVTLNLSEGFTIGVKGYGLIIQSKRAGSYKYFAELGDRLEAVESKTAYVDKVSLPSLLMSYYITTSIRSKNRRLKEATYYLG